ncbi:SCP2 sterol-binding domain-containing protein [Thalassotalea psychrophila]|uniref:Ubiquinone biosynthesis accessory factor UbiJ n=1 Tax=Thalassotalea psychrophila TaxID=3065647 RepID=A0ABY9TV18_9GAMM|nr:SCP2 sterol-binding domain-containing protein [Colwelliaceae bacterium SQ149]
MNIEQLLPKQILTALLEIIINKALSLDPNINSTLAKVNNKSLTLILSELGFPITLQVHQDEITVIASKLSTDCVIQTSLKTLPKLTQAELLTSLIKTGELDIIGDPKLAQQFASIFELLNIDWEQQIAERIGDIPAFKLGQLNKALLEKLSFANEQISQDASEYLLFEQRILVTETEINHFNQQVADVDQAVDNLAKRLTILTNVS